MLGRILNLYQYLHTGVCVADLGRSLDDLRAFPVGARRESGYQRDRVQQGLEPTDWKPMPAVGSGVREIRIRDASGAFRVSYVATLGRSIYVLHCFHKKTQQTAGTGLDLAANRYRQIRAQIEYEKGQQ